jgi:hypothetical protein
MNDCPHCLTALKPGANVCAACGLIARGKACPDCAEVVRAAAHKCRYCGHSFAREARIADFEQFSARADLLATLLIRGRLIPQQIHLSPEKITIQSWGLFGLSRTDEDIPWEKIAGFHYHAGWFWDAVEIQTRGQRANWIGCLRKAEGARVKELLEQMKE